MCRIKTFCCCCSLRAAAFIGAAWNLLFVIYMLSACALYLRAYFTQDHTQAPQPDKIETAVISYGATTLAPETTPTPEDLSTQHLVLGIFGGIRALIGSLVLILLCMGIGQRRASYFCPWLVMVMLLIIPGLLSIVVLFILGIHWIELVGDLISYSFWLYVWIAVYSYYKELEEGGPATAYVA